MNLPTTVAIAVAAGPASAARAVKAVPVPRVVPAVRAPRADVVRVVLALADPGLAVRAANGVAGDLASAARAGMIVAGQPVRNALHRSPCPRSVSRWFPIPTAWTCSRGRLK